MALFIPLIFIALYVGMYLLRTEKSGHCRWRQVGRDGEARLWRCQVCQGEGRTAQGEPKHCALLRKDAAED